MAPKATRRSRLGVVSVSGDYFKPLAPRLKHGQRKQEMGSLRLVKERKIINGKRKRRKIKRQRLAQEVVPETAAAAAAEAEVVPDPPTSLSSAPTGVAAAAAVTDVPPVCPCTYIQHQLFLLASPPPFQAPQPFGAPHPFQAQPYYSAQPFPAQGQAQHYNAACACNLGYAYWGRN